MGNKYILTSLNLLIIKKIFIINIQKGQDDEDGEEEEEEDSLPDISVY
jgi:hypothetical protein